MAQAPPPASAVGPRGPSAAAWSAAVEAVRTHAPAGRVLLACHVNPDGDALGSMLALAAGLRRLGATGVQASFPGPLEVPGSLAWLPGLDAVVPEDEAWPDPDLLVTLDAASPSRLGALAGRFATARASVVLDHHASNPGFGTVSLVDPDAAATSVLVEELLARLGVPLDPEIAECLYVALVTDTGSFRFDLTTPAVHEMAARLLRAGVRPADVSRRVFDSRPFGAVRLFADVLSRARLEPEAAGGGGLVWTYALLADLAAHGQRPHVLDALIDPVRATAEADVACVLKEAADGSWNVSMRSKGGADVSRVAGALGGGGHRLAAGFTGHGTADEVMAAIRAQL
ncbi:DHH family phosphoesterase [Spirilliplanes yamanashiensis]|uniref:DHH family phosphoesterase n=1 Tax=Spirilliplanes yamanashiensis TaxID=42233 RepID=UPI00194EEDFA|nr:bifunctional oligoribonuclease/PAP phosphatase NrnA [Spirilliplanes yamanashiensis]